MKMKALLVSIILIVSLTLSTGCGLITEVNTSPPESPPATSNVTPINTEWTMPSAESGTQTLPSIADVVTKVKPSVVAINTEVVSYDFFNRAYTQEGAGSGWIIDENGIIVTNNHVVEGAKSITVTLDDGRTFTADMATVATDPQADLAVLRIAAEDLPALTIGDSSGLRVGDWVIAIGNALGEGISATDGIVSRKNVTVTVDQNQTLYDLIQTNAAINPGNSGGPLVNLAGEVIGITSAKLSAVGIEGMGYAISTETAVPIIKALVTTGYVVRPWLGVGLYTVDQFVVQRYQLAVNEGVLVTSVSPGSPASKAGIKPGDVITKFGDLEIADVSTLIRAIHSSQIGQQVAVTFWRGTVENNIQATLTESPPPSQS